QDFSSVYDNFENGIERDTHGSIVETIPHQDLNDAQDLKTPLQIRLTKPKKSQNEMPEKVSDKRRGNINLTRVRLGLKAEDPIPDEL
ncbi:10180_t:CDS:2, partial [Paraglomus brasilianum]